MNYEGKCTKVQNESNHTKTALRKTAPTLLLPMMFYWIDKTTNESD